MADQGDDEVLKAFDEGNRKRRVLLKQRIAASEGGTMDSTVSGRDADKRELERLDIDHERRVKED